MGAKPGPSHYGKNIGRGLFESRNLRKIFGSKMKQQEAGENGTIRSFVIFIPCQILRSSNK
jgi:hypothetical protein